MVSLKSFKLINDGETDEQPDNVYMQRHEDSTKQQLHQHQRIFHHLDNHSIDHVTAATVAHSSHQAGSSTIQEDNDNLNNNYNNNKLKNKLKMAATFRAQENNFVLPRQPLDPANPAVVSVTLPSNSSTTINNQSAISPTPSSSSISIVVVQHDNNHLPSKIESSSSVDEDYTHDESSTNQSLDETSVGGELNTSLQLNSGQAIQGARESLIERADTNLVDPSKVYRDNLFVYSAPLKGQPDQSPDMAESRLSVTTESEHFEIVWSNLSYRIEPKWHKKFNFIDRIFTHFMSGQTVDNHSSATSTASSSAGMNDNQHQMHTSTNADSHLNNNIKQKSSPDPIEIFTNLNGTIKSGQMTAVLGPSGK